MSEEEIYKIINKEPIEYANLLKDIKTRADSNKNLDGKSECKLLMRYLKKQWQEIERLKIIEEKYKDSQLYIKDFKDEIEKLNNIIDNAIKGIEDFYYGDEEYKKYDYTLAYKIYHILKGSDK